jgi:hypothetical protein
VLKVDISGKCFISKVVTAKEIVGLTEGEQMGLNRPVILLLLTSKECPISNLAKSTRRWLVPITAIR